MAALLALPSTLLVPTRPARDECIDNWLAGRLSLRSLAGAISYNGIHNNTCSLAHCVMQFNHDQVVWGFAD